MPLNWREIALIVSELPLEGSMIQRVHQIGFHALVFEMHHPQTGSWELYAEVGTPSARLHRLGGPSRQSRKRKTAKLQRFIQFIRANVEGARIVEVLQPSRDRLLVWKLVYRGEILHLVLRFYSGPGANIIICDEQMTIRELLYRRPGRQETAGNLLELPTSVEVGDDGRFPVRDYPGQTTFNAFIEETYRENPESEPQDIVAQVVRKRDEAVAALEAEISQAAYRVEKSSGFDAYRISGDLLASAMHLIRPRTEWVEVPDYTNSEGGTATIAIDPTLSPSENVEAYYRKYRKGKATWDHALEDLRLVESRLAQTHQRFEQLLSPTGDDNQVDLKALESFLKPKAEPVSAKQDPYRNAPGLRFISGAFTILVGRNAKENEELLRRWARGHDWWMHTRDVPGGYVFIKSIAGKTIPLETLLDAGNLAVLYSKAKDAGKADLYYTQVKFLKRPKGGKTGLVLPTQEKNLTVHLDEPRVKRLFSTENEL